MSGLPPLPPGFTVDERPGTTNAPGPPEGFTIDKPYAVADEVAAKIASNDEGFSFGEYKLWREREDAKELFGEKKDELIQGIEEGAANLGKQVKGAGQEIGEIQESLGPIGQTPLGQAVVAAKLLPTAAESLLRWVAQWGVTGANISDKVGLTEKLGLAEFEDGLKGDYERLQSRLRRQAAVQTGNGETLVGDLATLATGDEEVGEAVGGAVRENTAQLGSLAPDFATTGAITRLARIGSVARFQNRATQLANQTARAMGAKGVKAAKKVDQAIAGALTSRRGMTGAGVVGLGVLPGVAVATGNDPKDVLLYEAGIIGTGLLARGGIGAMKVLGRKPGRALKAKLEHGMLGRGQLTYWDRVARDSAKPIWYRRAAMTAAAIQRSKGAQLAKAGTQGAVLEGLQEGIEGALQEGNTFREIGQGVGAGALIGGTAGAAFAGNVDNYLSDLDAMRYRDLAEARGDNVAFFDSLSPQDRRNFTDTQAFLGEAVDVRLVDGNTINQELGRTIPLAEGVHMKRGDEQVVYINTDVVAPDKVANVIGHEVGHAVYHSLPKEAKESWHRIAEENWSAKQIQKFKQSYENALNKGLPKEQHREISYQTTLDELFAEQFLGQTRRKGALRKKRSLNLTGRAGRELNLLKWRMLEAMGIEPQAFKPEGLMEFTPFSNAPGLQKFVNDAIADLDLIRTEAAADSQKAKRRRDSFAFRNEEPTPPPPAPEPETNGRRRDSFAFRRPESKELAVIADAIDADGAVTVQLADGTEVIPVGAEGDSVKYITPNQAISEALTPRDREEALSSQDAIEAVVAEAKRGEIETEEASIDAFEGATLVEDLPATDQQTENFTNDLQAAANASPGAQGVFDWQSARSLQEGMSYQLENGTTVTVVDKVRDRVLIDGGDRYGLQEVGGSRLLPVEFPWGNTPVGQGWRKERRQFFDQAKPKEAPKPFTEAQQRRETVDAMRQSSVLAAIREQGGIQPKSEFMRNQRRAVQQSRAGDADSQRVAVQDRVTRLYPESAQDLSRVFQQGSEMAPDQMATALGFESVDEMFDAVRQEAGQTTELEQGLREQEQAFEAEEAALIARQEIQDSRWDSASRTISAQTIQTPASQLGEVGDQFIIDGTAVTILEKSEGELVVDGGERFGVQIIPESATLPIEGFAESVELAFRPAGVDVEARNDPEGFDFDFEVKAARDLYPEVVASLQSSIRGFGAMVAEKAREFGGIPIVAPVKGAKRSAEKAAAYQAEIVAKRGEGTSMDWIYTHKMRDMLRGSVVVMDRSRLPGVVESIIRDPRFSEVRVKNRFESPTAAGYSDVMITANQGTKQDPVWVEIQVHIPEMLVMKDGWHQIFGDELRPENLGITPDEAGRGHRLYEEARSLPADSPRRQALENEMSVLYAKALELANQREAGGAE